MTTKSHIQEYMDKARKTCLWCRGTGFKDHDGLYRCEQCFRVATLLEEQATELGAADQFPGPGTRDD